MLHCILLYRLTHRLPMSGWEHAGMTREMQTMDGGAPKDKPGSFGLSRSGAVCHQSHEMPTSKHYCVREMNFLDKNPVI